VSDRLLNKEDKKSNRSLSRWVFRLPFGLHTTQQLATKDLIFFAQKIL